MSDRAPVGRQLLGVARLEWRRQLFGWKALLVVGLALLPVALVSAVVILGTRSGQAVDPMEVREGFANLFHGLVVRVVIFFGCLAIFLGQVRGELEQRSLHYLFLAPVSRTVVAGGKFLAGLAVAWVLFVGSTVASLVVISTPLGLGRFLEPAGLRELFWYSAMAALACLGYGTVFLLVGALLKSPGWIVALFFAWEWFQFLLPPLLKHLSVVHYVKMLTPFPISEGPFAVLADPIPPWLATLEVLAYAVVAFAVAATVVRRMEIDYSK